MRKTVLRYLPVLAVLAGLCTSACSSKAEYESKKMAEADYVSSTIGSNTDTTAVSSITQPERQFVRQADLKFRVKDVARTTHTIEDLTGKYGGFITQNHLSSSVTNTHSVQISADSLLETTEYQVENNLALRVPNQQLDQMLHELSSQVDFMHYRIINADDVSLQLLENKLRINRNTEAKQRVQQAIDSRGKKLGESLQGEQDLLALQERSDGNVIQNLSLADQVNYSTVKLHIYQRATARQERVAAAVDMLPYEPSLPSRLAEAFLSGWTILEASLIGLVQLWAVILLGLLAWLGYRRYGVRLLGK